MVKDLTEVIFILDRSGSMTGKEHDTIGGFNSLIKKQKEVKGRALITTILFDDRYEVLYDEVDLMKVEPMNSKQYYTRGCTALLDAIGITIDHKKAEYKANWENNPEHTIVVITTDGLENASERYTYREIKLMVEQMTDMYGWEFIFLGANIDAIDAAESIGIKSSRAANYVQDGHGSKVMFDAVCNFATMVREDADMSCDECCEAWKEDLDADYAERGAGSDPDDDTDDTDDDDYDPYQEDVNEFGPDDDGEDDNNII